MFVSVDLDGEFVCEGVVGGASREVASSDVDEVGNDGYVSCVVSNQIAIDCEVVHWSGIHIEKKPPFSLYSYVVAGLWHGSVGPLGRIAPQSNEIFQDERSSGRRAKQLADHTSNRCILEEGSVLSALAESEESQTSVVVGVVVEEVTIFTGVRVEVRLALHDVAGLVE